MYLDFTGIAVTDR